MQPPSRRVPVSRSTVALLLTSLATGLISAAPARPAATKPASKGPTPKPVRRHRQIDHGPFVTATIPAPWPGQGITNKAIAVRLVG